MSRELSSVQRVRRARRARLATLLAAYLLQVPLARAAEFTGGGRRFVMGAGLSPTRDGTPKARATEPARPLAEKLASLPSRWLPWWWSADRGSVLPLQTNLQRLLDPTQRAVVLGALKRNSPQGTAFDYDLRGAAFAALANTMRSDLPATERAHLGQQLSSQLGEFARALHRERGIRTSTRVAWGRIDHRFLRGNVLLAELAREREVTALLAKARAALEPPPRVVGQTEVLPQTAPPIPWKIPAAVPKERIAPGPFEVITADLPSIKRTVEDSLAAYERQTRRYRLAQNGLFSEAFVDKQRSALAERRRMLESDVLWAQNGTARFVSSDLGNAFVLTPRSVAESVVVKRAKATLGGDDLGNILPQASKSLRAMRLHNEGDGMRIEATFETRIADEAVLRAVKESIETAWQGTIASTPSPVRLRVAVDFRRLAAEVPFSEGALRLVESDRCAIHGGTTFMINRSFGSGFRMPAHEFGHLLGLPDQYKTGYLPRARRVVHAQDHATLMGSRSAPITAACLEAAYRNLLQALASAGPSHLRPAREGTR